jgi:hypothetical protein
LVSHIKGRTLIEGVLRKITEENIWIYERGSGGPEEIA